MLTRPHGAFLSSFFASNPREARGLADPPQIGPVNFPEVGFGASSPIRYVVSHRLQGALSGHWDTHPISGSSTRSSQRPTADEADRSATNHSYA